MPGRMIEINGAGWEVAPSGKTTVYGRDEFGLVFKRVTGGPPERRVVRYSPLGSRIPEASFDELSDQQLKELWNRSQPGWTAPETGYNA
ncbi:MAG TPA: hypothetical protein VLB12_13745 [Gemmatimonadales bacterium]|nr:hypothetical protein [Gemmatimonadales bacterium]